MRARAYGPATGRRLPPQRDGAAPEEVVVGVRRAIPASGPDIGAEPELSEPAAGVVALAYHGHPVITSAGSAAGIDACLYVVRKEQGTKVANQIARRMVVAPHRDGGQAQFVDRPLPAEPADTLAEVTGWLERHLDQQVTVAELASLAHMSPRTFARRFVQETGTTPLRWLTGQRILLAQRLLEDTEETVDWVADRAGFGNAMALRHHFRAWRGTTPAAYRSTFRTSEAVGQGTVPRAGRAPAR
jgi:transcriptional regulator GlxA family with amidase domain